MVYNPALENELHLLNEEFDLPDQSPVLIRQNAVIQTTGHHSGDTTHIRSNLE